MPALITPRLARRQKIIYSAMAMAIFLFTLVFWRAGEWGIIGMLVVAYCATIVSLGTDLRREEWIVLPLYSILVSTVIYVWSSQNLTTPLLLLGGSLLFGIIMYGTFLTLNILNVATVRVLPLARTAKTVLSMIGLVISFSLFYLTIINQPSMVSWVAFVAGITLLISWPLIWTSMTDKQRLVRSISWSIITSLLMVQLAAIVGFWPVSFMSSLFLAGVLFIILGILHLQEKKQLNQALKSQYLVLGGVVTIMMYLLTQW